MTMAGHDGDIITVRVPMKFRKRGGRKLVIAQDGAAAWVPPRTRVDNILVKALARAFRWRKLLETGIYGTVREIAAVEKVSSSYVSRILRLTLLAPDVVEMILDGRQPANMNLISLQKPLFVDWESQRRLLGIAAERYCPPPAPEAGNRQFKISRCRTRQETV